MLKYLIEIKNRFILLTIVFCSMIFICYMYKEVLLFLITQTHLNNMNFYFIFTDVTELFSVYFRLIIFLTSQTVIWYLLYHMFTFFSPALFFYEYKTANFFLKSLFFFWLFSVILSIYILIPFGWNFFLSFQLVQAFSFEARITEYYSFYTNIYFLSLTYCQFFTLSFFFLSDIAQNYLYIKKFRKLYYYVFVLFATLVSPPDIFSQILISFFISIFFESLLFLFMVRFFTKLI